MAAEREARSAREGETSAPANEPWSPAREGKASAPAKWASAPAREDGAAREEGTSAALHGVEAATHATPRNGRGKGADTGAADAARDALGGLIHLLLAADPNVRPRHAAWVARELLALRDGAASAPAARNEDPPAIRTAPARSIAPAAAPATLIHHPPLVGRDAALATITAAAERAAAGSLQITLIRGPLGAGRTRLLDAAIAAAAVPESRVLRGACSPERQSSLLPLVRALEAVPRGRATGLAAVEEAAFEALAPRKLRAARDARVVVEAVEAVEEALLWAAASEPLVLAIDDAQWADPYTLALLSLLCDRAHAGGEGRLFVVAAVRDEPRPPAPLRALATAARSRADGSTVTITLDPLPQGDLARVAEGVGRLSPELSRAVVRGAGGVPFFLVHALFAWRDTGAIALQDGVWRAADATKLDEGVPGVADLVEARLASAFEGDPSSGRVAMRALAAVALSGGLALETLLAVSGDPAAVEASLETLVDMQLLVVRGPRCEHAFAQEMIRQAVRNIVRAKPWFLRLHRALLDALAAAPEGQVDAAFLATGYDELGDADKARAWLGRAMEGAMAAGLLAEAVTMGDRRAALARTPAERARAVLDTVRALLAARRFEDADLRLRMMKADADVRKSAAPGGARTGDARARRAGAAGERDDAPREARDFEPTLRGGAGGDSSAKTSENEDDLRRRILALQVARGLHVVMDDPSLLPAVDTSGDLSLRCDARMALAGALGGSRGHALAAEAVALAETGDPAVEYGARVGRAELIYASDPRDLALAHRDLERALAIAEARASRLHRLQIESDLAVVEADQGHVDASIDRLARLADEADAHGMRGERRRLVQNRAAFLLRQGRAKEAAEAAAEAARLSRAAGDPVLCASAWSIRADALRRAGDLTEARLAIDEALRLQDERGDRMRALSLLRRAEIVQGLGDLASAAHDAADAATIARATGDRWIVVASELWEALHRAQIGAGSPADLERTLAEAAAPDIAPRAVVRSLVARARAWIQGEPPPDTR